MARVFVFPGQGSQKPGMGSELSGAFPIARETFQEVDDALEFRLSRIMWEGPEHTLTLTENAQPALMAVSLAVMRVLQHEGGLRIGDAILRVAGHSLGEYTALVAAGSIELAETARLLRLRGRAMQEAVPQGGAMAALLGGSREGVEAALAQAKSAGIIAIANDNAPGQVVVSGEVAAVERAAECFRAEKGKATMLPVSAPFHCSMLQPAARVMAEALQDITFRDPEPALVSNVTAQTETDGQTIRALLVEQVCSTVRWRESVQHMCELGMSEQVELGVGKVLSGLARRINRDIMVHNIGTPAEIDAFMRS